MSGGESQQNVITVSLERLFDRIELKLDRIESKLDGKADRADVDALRERLATLEGAATALAPLVAEVAQLEADVRVLQDTAVAATSVRKYKGRFVALFISVGGLAASVAGLVIAKLV